MSDRPARTLSIAASNGPPPPLAGALAAWLRRRGESIEVVVGGTSGDEVWAHLEADADDDRVQEVSGNDLHYFGPGVEDPAVRDAIRRHDPTAEIVRGDPEREPDVAALPVVTWDGFPPLQGAVRMLAGRGPRPRPLARVVREIVYVVETHGVGHLMFDDADLADLPGYPEALLAELEHLPWALTWEGTVRGDRVSGETISRSPE